MSKVVGELDRTTGDQVMVKDDATGKWKTSSLTGGEAIQQNILNQLWMLRFSGYRGTVRGDQSRGVPWKPVGKNNPEMGLLGTRMPHSAVAMVLGLETRRVPGVVDVTDIDVRQQDEADRKNRRVEPVIAALVGDDDFPVQTVVSFKFTQAS